MVTRTSTSSAVILLLLVVMVSYVFSATTTTTTTSSTTTTAAGEEKSWAKMTPTERRAFYLNRYSSVLPIEEFVKLQQIYDTAEFRWPYNTARERMVTELLSDQPADVKARLPAPWGFLHFSKEEQKGITQIFYNSDHNASFDQKMQKVKIYLEQGVPENVYFAVNVTLHLDGNYQVMTEKEFKRVDSLQRKRTIYETTRKREMGDLLRDIFRSNSSRMPPFDSLNNPNNTSLNFHIPSDAQLAMRQLFFGFPPSTTASQLLTRALNITEACIISIEDGDVEGGVTASTTTTTTISTAATTGAVGIGPEDEIVDVSLEKK